MGYEYLVIAFFFGLATAIIGRGKGTGAPLGKADEFDAIDFAAKASDGSLKVAEDSHVRLAHPQFNKGAELLRRGYNFVDGSDGLGRLDAGLFFLAYQRDPRKQFIPHVTAPTKVRAPKPKPKAVAAAPKPAATATATAGSRISSGAPSDAEIRAQLAAFRAALGRDPTHLDSHHHAHRRDTAATVAASLAEELGVDRILVPRLPGVL